ncbi:MAG TPA: GNAT family N-acetyltransferase [Nocardioides sp.]|uniref:GNAT family N-acetyltransferase n=1 Tax=Nocardioides sp. TaxID=35761 RepID=UPI002E320588|nr:GNAT family N-acetyltransferase [Nocardioides sp.]HEX3930091.1 GNAT family N-acetyltransferase [Nocardioides sp.]
MVSVRTATAGDVAALSAAMAEGFVGEAVTGWMLPQRLGRQARLRRMFAIELEVLALPRGGLVLTADDAASPGRLVGGCIVLPPDQWQMPKQTDGRTALRWLRVYGRWLTRAIRVQRVMEEHHPTQPHYYVRWVAVRPGLRDAGLGRALMQPALDRCDSEHLPAYIEASSERSAALYERLGFVHQGMYDLPEGGPPIWPMVRPAAA